jgi:hypothetical protein
VHHVGTITKSSRNPNLPFHAQCSCGPAGDFSAKESAVAYLQAHFAKLAGVSTHELVDNSDKREAKPVLSQAAAAAPPPPPPPPDDK